MKNSHTLIGLFAVAEWWPVKTIKKCHLFSDQQQGSTK